VLNIQWLETPQTFSLLLSQVLHAPAQFDNSRLSTTKTSPEWPDNVHSRNTAHTFTVYVICYIIIIIIITRTVFMVLSSWLRVIARVHPVHVMNAEQRQTAADLWTKLTDLSFRPTCRLLGNHIHHRHVLFITQPESWHSFYHPTEGRRLSWPRWMVTYPDSLPACKQSPIQVVTVPVSINYVYRSQHANYYTMLPACHPINACMFDVFLSHPWNK